MSEIPKIKIGIERIDVFKIPPPDSIPTTPHITRKLDLTKPSIDFLVPSYKPLETNLIDIQDFKSPQTPEPTNKKKVPKTKTDTTIPPIPEIKIECPAKDQAYRLGDIRNAQAKEKVIGFEVVNNKCVEIWGPTNIADKYLPSPSVASTTFVVTVISVTAATITPILTKLLKPLYKQLITRAKKMLGKKTKLLSTSERRKMQRDRRK